MPPPSNRGRAAVLGGVTVAAMIAAAAPFAIHMITGSEAEGRPGRPGFAYADPGYGWRRATICYGHVGDYHPGDRLNHEACVALLHADLTPYATGAFRCIAPAMRSRVTPAMGGAFIDAAYNVGPVRFCQRIVPYVNRGDLAGACRALDTALPHTSNGIRMAGLDRRRHDERVACERGLTP